jgi:membrane-associated phospholipid phosphatase
VPSAESLLIKPLVTLQSCLGRLSACLPHELFFAILFVTCISGLCSARRCSLPLLAFFFALLVVQLSLIAFCHTRPTQERWRLRLFYCALLIPVVYPLLPSVADALGCSLQDQALQRIDNVLVGFNLSVYLQQFNRPYLTELLSGAYMSYTTYFAVSAFLYLYDEIELAIRFYMGIFTVFALGFLGYVLVPAHGPYLALSNYFTVSLSGGFLTYLNQEIVRLGSIRIDVFPSLHCAVPVFILFFDFSHKRKRFWLCLLPCLLLLSSTLYLRYHYLTDLIAGFALAMLALGVSMWWPLKKEINAVSLLQSGESRL